MSQAKIDKYKSEKYNRKNAKKQSKIKDYLSYTGVTVVAAAIVFYLGYSIAIETGLYTPPETTTKYVGTVTAEQLATNLDSGTASDPLGYYAEAKAANSESQTTAASEEATAAEDTTAAE